MPEKLTEPQKRALGEIGDGVVLWSRFSLDYWNHRTKKYMRVDTMRALRERGLFTVLDHDMVVLTDRGRDVLRDA